MNPMPTRTSSPDDLTSNGIAKLERITKTKLAPLNPPPDNPTVQEAMEAWIAMARGYASIVVRQHEFEYTTIEVLKHMDRRLDALSAVADLTEEEPTSEPPTSLT